MQITQTTIQFPDIELHFPFTFSQPYRLEFWGSAAAAVARPMSGDASIAGDGAISGDGVRSHENLGTMPPVTLSQAFSLKKDSAYSNLSGYQPDTTKIGAPSLCKNSAYSNLSGYQPDTTKIGAPSLCKNK